MEVFSEKITEAASRAKPPYRGRKKSPEISLVPLESARKQSWIGRELEGNTVLKKSTPFNFYKLYIKPRLNVNLSLSRPSLLHGEITLPKLIHTLLFLQFGKKIRKIKGIENIPKVHLKT